MRLKTQKQRLWLETKSTSLLFHRQSGKVTKIGRWARCEKGRRCEVGRKEAQSCRVDNTTSAVAVQLQCSCRTGRVNHRPPRLRCRHAPGAAPKGPLLCDLIHAGMRGYTFFPRAKICGFSRKNQGRAPW